MVGSPVRRARREAAAAEAGEAAAAPEFAPAQHGDLPTSRRTEPAAYATELQAEVIALGEYGLSEAEMASHLAVSLDTLNGWRRQHADFAEAMSRALTAAQGWWESKVRIAINKGDTRFAVGAWQACVRARFPAYAERVEIAHTFDVTERLVMIDLRPAQPAQGPLEIEAVVLAAEEAEGAS